MKIIEDWRRVVKHAWSVRLLILAGVLSGLEAVLPLVGDACPIPTGVFAGLSVFVTMAAFVMRIVSQKEFRDGE